MHFHFFSSSTARLEQLPAIEDGEEKIRGKSAAAAAAAGLDLQSQSSEFSFSSNSRTCHRVSD